AGVAALALSVMAALWVVPNFFDVPTESITEFQIAVVLVGVQLLVGFPLSIFDAIYEGRQRFDVLSGVSLLCRGVSAVAILVVLTLGYGIIALVLIQIAAALVQAASFAALLPRLVPQVKLSLRRMGGRHYRQLRAYSGWSSLNEL